MLTSTLSIVLAFASQFPVIMIDGSYPDLWKRAAVLYAEILDVKKVPDPPGKQQGGEYGEYTVRVRPLATLTGDFDSALRADIPLHVSIVIPATMSSSSIENIPPAGKRIVVMTMWNDDTPQRRYDVTNSKVTFLPSTDGGYPALFEVTGFDDPKVTETIENLRKLRADRWAFSIVRALQATAEADKNGAAKSPATVPSSAAVRPAAPKK